MLCMYSVYVTACLIQMHECKCTASSATKNKTSLWDTVCARRLKLFGHVARADKSQDHCCALKSVYIAHSKELEAASRSSKAWMMNEKWLNLPLHSRNRSVCNRSSGVRRTGEASEGVPRRPAAHHGPQTRRDAWSSLAQTDAADTHRVRHESRDVHAAEHLRHGTQPVRRRHQWNSQHRHQGGSHREGHQVLRLTSSLTS